MDPASFRKARDAMMDYGRRLESHLAPRSGSPPATPSEHADADADDGSMEWTPTGSPQQTSPPLPAVGDGADENLDQLMHGLQQVLNPINKAVFSPSTIEVPKDFGLQMAISINHLLAQIAHRELVDEHRRQLGYVRDPDQSVPLGFDPAQLIAKEAIALSEKTPQMPSLSNEIHPVFRPENFHACPDDIYNVLKPALRLASLLLTHRATASFWHTLVFGERELCPKTTEAYGQKCWRIREDVAWTAANAERFQRFLLAKIDAVHFLFHPEPLPPYPTYASMILLHDYKLGQLRKRDGSSHANRICLHTDFYTTAKRLSLLRHREPGMVLRFNLFLANCLAHEMAHFVEACVPQHERELGNPEVFLNDNTWSESGICFECKTFGGRIHPIATRLDCGLGLATVSHPLKDVLEREENVMSTVPMTYVSMIQQQKTWDALEPGSTALLIPRTGTQSAEINGANLMIWEDEEAANISDRVDGRETMFHRLDDGQIVQNPQRSIRSGKHTESRWSPYKRPPNDALRGCVRTEPVDAKGASMEPKVHQEQNVSPAQNRREEQPQAPSGFSVPDYDDDDHDDDAMSA